MSDSRFTTTGGAAALLMVLALAGLVGMVAASVDSLAPEPTPLKTAAALAPTLRDGQAPWRIGYYEAGFYTDYPQHLVALIEGLISLGWMQPMDLPSADAVTDSRALWQALASRADGRYIRLEPNAFWSYDWDQHRRPSVRAEALEVLASGRIDFMIAMGTQAGLDLRDGHAVPTTVVSSTDPILAGIVDSADDSGRDHLHAACDPDRHYRQIRAFHNICRFRTLGVIQDDSPESRVYAHLDDLEAAAREMGFALVISRVPEQGLTDEQCRRHVAEAIAQAAPQIDAFWVSDLRGLHAQHMPELLRPLLVHGVPSWTPTGTDQVRRGVTFGMPEENLRQLGLFHAKAMAAVFHGARPRDLPMVIESRRSVLVNAASARAIGMELPRGLVSVADRIFDRIEVADRPEGAQP